MRAGRFSSTIATLCVLMILPHRLGAAPPVASAPAIKVVTTFDYPIAEYRLPAETFTVPRGINNAGDIVGYTLNGTEERGFIRYATGTFSPPLINPADTTQVSTEALGINIAGTIVGEYLGLNGFVLAGGHYVNMTNDEVFGINDQGQTCGIGNGTAEDYPLPAFILSQGKRTTFFAPGANTITSETFAHAINNLGAVAGSFTTDLETTFAGFHRDVAGNITVIKYPGACRTIVTGLNDNGWMVGHYVDGIGVDHAFLLINGKFTPYDYPGASGTRFNGINVNGQICGRYTGADGASHGLILKAGP